MGAKSDVKCHRFTGKRAVVTASTDGIGYAIARRLAQEGAEVWISSRSAAKVEKTLKQLRDVEKLDVHGTVCHVAKDEDRKRLIDLSTKQYTQPIDVLVSNAAVSPYVGMTVDISEQQYDKIMDTNVKATWAVLKAFEPHLSEGGAAVIISSYVGYCPRFPIGMYGVSKTALFGLTKTMSTDLWTKRKVRLNCVAPGVIETNFSKVIWEDEEAFSLTKGEITQGRLGQIEEIAAPVAFLCSDDASYITGETLVVGGGINARL